MLKVYCFVLAIALTWTATLAQPPQPAWTRTYGDLGNQRAFALCNAPDGGVVMAGFNMPSGQTLYGPFALRASDTGDSLWSCSCPISLNAQGSNYCRAVAPAADGGFVFGGCAFTTGSPPFLYELSVSGSEGWTQTYSSWLGMDLRAVVQSADGGLVAAGTWANTFPDLLVFKTDPQGTVIWSHPYGGTGADSANALVALPDSGVAVAGSYQSSAGNRTYLVRLNANGDTLWTRTYGTSAFNSAGAIAYTRDHGFILAGVSDFLTAGAENVNIIRTDSSGNLLWETPYAIRGAGNTCGASAVVQLPDGSFIIAGWLHWDSGTNYDAFLARVNADGDTLWTSTFGDVNGDRFKGLAASPDGGFYAGGYYVGSGGLNTDDFFLVHYRPQTGVQGYIADSAHSPVESVRVSTLDQATFAESDILGHYILPVPAGTYDLVINGPCTARDTVRGLIVPPDSFITHDWTVSRPRITLSQTSITLIVHNHHTDSARVTMRNLDSGLLDFSIRADATDPPGNWLSVSPTSGMLLAHDSLLVTVRVAPDTANGHNYEFFGFVRIHSNSCPDTAINLPVTTTVLAADNPGEALPTRFDLSAYPNPFNPRTTLSLSLPQRTMVSLVLYDVTGRVVRTLCDGWLDAGVRELSVDGSALPSGLYFARLSTPAITRTQKLVLLK